MTEEQKSKDKILSLNDMTSVIGCGIGCFITIEVLILLDFQLGKGTIFLILIILSSVLTLARIAAKLPPHTDGFGIDQDESGKLKYNGKFHVWEGVLAVFNMGKIIVITLALNFGVSGYIKTRTSPTKIKEKDILGKETKVKQIPKRLYWLLDS